MIGNGDSKPISELNSYIQYRAFMNSKPQIWPSNRKFCGLGDGTETSNGTAMIRMPVGPQLLLLFDV